MDTNEILAAIDAEIRRFQIAVLIPIGWRE
jgi:hypothetical protein